VTVSATKLTDPLLVNLGCGNRFHPAWLNLDLHSHAKEVRECDLSKGIPLPEFSATAVYSAAVVEHIPRINLRAYLAECFRELKRGGIVRLSVPDFRRQVTAYLDAIKRAEAGVPRAAADHEWMILEIVDQIGRNIGGGGMAAFFSGDGPSNLPFVVERIGEEGQILAQDLRGRHLSSDIDLNASRNHLVRGGWVGRVLLKWLLRSRDLKTELAALEVGRFRLTSGEVHQWVYDDWSLKQILNDTGFTNLRTRAHGDSDIPEWESFLLEVDEFGSVRKPDLFVVEGIKP